jgi:hypothetical protein
VVLKNVRIGQMSFINLPVLFAGYFVTPANSLRVFIPITNYYLLTIVNIELSNLGYLTLSSFFAL